MNSLSAKYKTQQELVEIGDLTFQLIKVTNIDELYLELINKGGEHEDVKDERIPYWADLWHSAIALSKYIVETNVIKKNMQVLEIGCGLGLPGIVAGKFSNHITFTDYIKEPLEFAEYNWKLNNDHAAQFKILDWRKPDASFASDVVLASDVAYEKRSFKYLLHSFKKLTKPGGLILMSEPNRQFTREFFRTLKDKGFVFSTVEYNIHYNGISTKVNVYEIKAL
ncbi:MAG TPA: methyltransferase domain-containing protein [Bacteroidia bacterium]|nr:methyltransferase domain-containing protein [Bacteroidia bacterium]